MYHVSLNHHVCKKLQLLDVKSRLTFEKCIMQLKENGCLPEEVSLLDDSLFGFQINNDWIAIAKRHEAQTWLKSRNFKIKIEILDFCSASNFEYFKPSIGIKKVAKVITSFFLRRYLPPTLLVITLMTIAFILVGYKYPGEVKWKMETDGMNVNGEVTIDGCHTQPETDDTKVNNQVTINSRQSQ